MKTILHFSHSMALCCMWFVVSAGIGLVEADEPAPPARTPSNPPQLPQAPAYDLIISDGAIRVSDQKRAPSSLANVVDSLRGLYPEANIALSPNLRDTEVQDLKLRGARIEDALEAIRIASGNAFQWRIGNDGRSPGMDPTTGMPLPPVQEDRLSLYLLEENKTAKSPFESRSIEVFHVRGYLDSLNLTNREELNVEVDRLLRIVMDTITDLKQGQNPLNRIGFRWHDGANLLVATGDPEALKVAHQVLTALPGVSTSTQTANPEPRTNPEGEAARQSLLRRYGLSSGAAESPIRPGMTPEMRRRYGLPPAPSEQPQPPPASGQRR